MRHIAKVDIVLENCEYITLDSKYFGDLFMQNLLLFIHNFQFSTFFSSTFF